MIRRLKQLLVDFWIVLAFGLAAVLLMPQAHAGMLGVQDLERERVKAMLERPEVVKGLEKYGVDAQEARGRVDAMSDAEVLQLAGKLDAAAPADDFHDLRCAGVEDQAGREDHTHSLFRAVGKQDGVADAASVEIDIRLLDHADVIKLAHCFLAPRLYALMGGQGEF